MAAALVRVIAGDIDGHAGPGVTHTPITLLHATIEPGAQLRLPWRKDFNALGYVLAGSGTVGADKRPVRTGQLAVFGPGDVLTFGAERVMDGPGEKLDVLVLGGQPIREPVAAYGPFVMNTRPSWCRRSRTTRPAGWARSRLSGSPPRCRPSRTPATTSSNPSTSTREPAYVSTPALRVLPGQLAP